MPTGHAQRESRAADPDTVDGLATHEFYLEASGTASALASIRGKPDSDGSVFAARGRARAALAALTAPIIYDRVLPFVNERYADACGATGCVVCQSLVRRYLPGERQGHGTHFDIQALVTVVVSLSSFGTDFDGGLFVTTGAAAAGGETAFVGLQVRLRCRMDCFLQTQLLCSPAGGRRCRTPVVATPRRTRGLWRALVVDPVAQKRRGPIPVPKCRRDGLDSRRSGWRGRRRAVHPRAACQRAV